MKRDLLELVQSHGIKVAKAGKEWKGKCPFHEDKTASFFVNPEKNAFYCHGCGAGGGWKAFQRRIYGEPVPVSHHGFGGRKLHPRAFMILSGNRWLTEEELLDTIPEWARIPIDQIRRHFESID